MYDIISLNLDSIQHNVDFDAEDRARASGLLISMLSRETLTTLFFMDVYSHLPKVFVKTQISTHICSHLSDYH